MSSHVSENRIKVLIADDHALIRQGLKSLLSFDPAITVVAEAEEGKSIVPMLKQYRPDVLLMDINMPGMTGIEVLSEIKAENMQIKIIFLTVEDNQKIIMKAIEIGADGYVLKGSPPEELIEAVKSVYFGENYIDKSLVSVLFDKVMHRSEGQKYFRELTDREMEILFYISKGLSNKEIGEKLFLSEKTIKNNATRIFRKIGVNDRVQATIFAIENELSKFMQNI